MARLVHLHVAVGLVVVRQQQVGKQPPQRTLAADRRRGDIKIYDEYNIIPVGRSYWYRYRTVSILPCISTVQYGTTCVLVLYTGETGVQVVVYSGRMF